MLASDLIARARDLLNDTGAVRWSDNELLNWINEGQQRLARLRPKYFVKTTNIQLQPGVLQQLPSDGILLQAVVRNMGATGNTPGRAISRVDKRSLDVINPDWPSDPADAVVRRYIYDPNSPLLFYVYPAQPSPGSYVEISYSALPAKLTATSNSLGVPEDMAPLVLDFVMYRALSRDAPEGGNTAAAAFYQSFLDGVNAL